ncbi:hypothetical protein NDU88_007085 [Pleurodeles waltl]|uniref:Uncharacterized protein n=1 Tax=Pleurodeles waltl TaxID=8319 RepID=A0AAV7MFB9_PLEWA|nr:hypothetical protein NDU88_007085 [Pleurodeles waltl]
MPKMAPRPPGPAPALRPSGGNVDRGQRTRGRSIDENRDAGLGVWDIRFDPDCGVVTLRIYMEDCHTTILHQSPEEVVGDYFPVTKHVLA